MRVVNRCTEFENAAQQLDATDDVLATIAAQGGEISRRLQAGRTPAPSANRKVLHQPRQKGRWPYTMHQVDVGQIREGRPPRARTTHRAAYIEIHDDGVWWVYVWEKTSQQGEAEVDRAHQIARDQCERLGFSSESRPGRSSVGRRGPSV